MSRVLWGVAAALALAITLAPVSQATTCVGPQCGAQGSAPAPKAGSPLPGRPGNNGDPSLGALGSRPTPKAGYAPQPGNPGSSGSSASAGAKGSKP